MKLAVIADIHGNAPALAAVLADLAATGAGAIVQLGDACNGPIDPLGTLALLRGLQHVRHVRGNGDRRVGIASEPATLGSVRFTRERLAPDDLEWLGSWPQVIEGEGWLACHGSPWDDEEYLLEDVTTNGVFLRQPRDILKRLGPTLATLVLCAHSHVPRIIQPPGGPLIVNPGSVGLPAYELSEPHPHKMEAGSPHARYALVERRSGAWQVEQRAVPYDWESAARQADENGWPDWARAVRTGLV